MSSLDFEYSQEQLMQTANNIILVANRLGATSSQVEINESIASSIDVLNGGIENFETSYDRTMALTVYIGNKRGSIGTTGIIHNNLEQIVTKALEIAKYTEDDPHNAIAESQYICKSINQDLQLYNPIELSNDELINRTKNIEYLGLKGNHQITSSDGSSLSLVKHNFVIANTNDLNLGYKTTRYNASLSLIANTNDGMQTDFWYTSSRDFNNLASDNELAQTAINRVIRRINKGQAKLGNYPVIFESTIAKSIIGGFLGAISGNNLYRKLSFLNDSMSTQVFPEWVNIYEDPFLIKGLSSCYFDNEGVIVAKRDIVTNGIVTGYILSSYTARKLNLPPTGNAGGNHNLFISSNTSGGVEVLAKQMNKGLIVIETIGHGLNMVTGDYSVGASGLWVENGEITHFVDNITISGNLKEVLKNIVYISDDYVSSSSTKCGSMLVEGITISG